MLQIREERETASEIDVEQGNICIKFGAPWCGPCTLIEPVFRKFASTPGRQAVYLSVNIDLNADYVARYQILNLPTFVFLSEGKEISRMVGSSPDLLKKQIDEFEERIASRSAEEP